MLIRVLRDTVAAGHPVKVNDVVDVPDHDARTLVLIGKGEKYDGAAPAPASSSPPPAPDEEQQDDDDLVEDDPDLGEEQGSDELAALTYEQLCSVATELGIAKADKTKKTKLIELIREARAQAE